MKAQRKILFTVIINKTEVTYMADNKEHLILMIAALKKHHNGLRVIKSSIKLSNVLVFTNNGRTMILDKAA